MVVAVDEGDAVGQLFLDLATKVRADRSVDPAAEDVRLIRVPLVDLHQLNYAFNNLEVLIFGVAWHNHEEAQHLQHSLRNSLEVLGGVFKIITNGGENALEKTVSLANQPIQQCNLSRHLEKVDLREVTLNCWNSDVGKSDACFHKSHCFLCVLAFNKRVAADTEL